MGYLFRVERQGRGYLFKVERLGGVICLGWRGREEGYLFRVKMRGGGYFVKGGEAEREGSYLFRVEGGHICLGWRGVGYLFWVERGLFV